MEVVEPLFHLSLGLFGVLILHLSELVDYIGESLLDVTHGDLFISLAAVSDQADAVVVELNDCFHHAHRLVHGAVVVFL